MPVTGAKSSGPEKGPGGGGRTTFRPPWVKEGSTTTTPAPTNKAPWVRKAETTVVIKENGQPPVKEAKLQSREIKVPVMTTKLKPVQPPLKPKDERRDSTASVGEKEPVAETKKEFLMEKPKLRHVESIPKEKSKTPNELPEQPKLRPVLKKTPKVDEKEKPPPPFETKLSSVADRKIPPPPPPPPNAPNAPPPPPPPSLAPPTDFQKKPLSEKQKDVLDKLKQRARRRPDWSEMMKEVEDGRKLRHVECNDRSRPILTVKSMTKVGGQFVFETEKANVHNKLLQQIQSGIRLKPVKTNDRSKPFLEGLRKFRRQMTIEEQIQKSESRAVLNEEPEESEDEMDDIDKLRDDLQSTKQMLALELRNKEAQERENKLLLAKIANLEAELDREKSKSKSDSNTSVSNSSSSSADEALVNSLKKDADEARKTCKELEKKYQQSAEQLDSARSEIEEHKRMIANLEKKLVQGFNKSFSKSNSSRSQFGFCYSFEDSNDSDIYYEQGGVDTRRPSEAVQKESSPEPEIEESESESDEDEEKKAERLARRLAREVKMLSTKLQKIKDKQQAAQKERTNLKEAMKKNQALLKEETKRFKKLQKEVDKMAKMLHEDEEDEDALEKDEEEEEEEEEEESESEEETETEESEEESGSETESESEDEDASDEDKKTNLEPRIKKHEGRLNALKKGNYLLQTNVDRLLDEVNKMREQSASLQRDLDSVLSELG